MNLEKIAEIIDRNAHEKEGVIQLLLDIQGELNWVPREAMEQIGKRLQIPLSEIYQVASFYKAISLNPRGRHVVNICLGTACHVRGGARIMDKAKEILGVSAGKTTSDMEFTLGRVNCLGCCALGPVMVVDGEAYGKLTPAKVGEVLSNYQ